MKRAVFAAAFLSAQLALSGDALFEGFLNPPRSSAPETWWHWMNGNVTKEGITADLEAMAWAGLSGAQMFDVDCDIPAGPVAFGTDAWFEMVEHAHREAKRLGLRLAIHNCSGFSSSGGPWVTPADSMKKVVVSELCMKGPAESSFVLPRPRVNEGFYRDIRVLAVPASDGELFPEAEESPKAVERVLGQLYVKTLDFREPCAAAQLQLRVEGGRTSWRGLKCHVTVKASDDGERFVPVLDMPEYSLWVGKQAELETRYIDFPAEVSARHYRIFVDFKGLEKSGFRVCDAKIGRVFRVPFAAIAENALYARTGNDEHTPIDDDRCAVEKFKVMDLTSFLDGDTLKCTIPEGTWQIFRIGYTSIGVKNHPATAGGIGLEVDKFSAPAVERFFDGYMGPLCKRLGIDKGGAGIVAALIDSYEVGCQNWTEGFEGEFMRRCGYDMTPYLLFFAGKLVNSAKETSAFLTDFRRVASELFCENYARVMRRKCNEAGLSLIVEPYGGFPADNQRYGAAADDVMWEFWCRATQPEPMYQDALNVYPVASVAHVLGNRRVSAESFTSSAAVRGWTQDLWSYKGRGDEAYAAGVNNVVYHRWAHQPWTNPPRLPGMTMGPWGTSFERTQTWWPFVRPWIRYQTRCQHLLQEGRPARDILFFSGSSQPNSGGWNSTSAKPSGNDPLIGLQLKYGISSLCGSMLRSLSVEDGRLVAPSGVSYSALMHNPDQSCSFADKRLLEEWRSQGVKIVDAFPTEGELARAGVEPDFIAPEGARFIHRRYDDGTEGYFVAWTGDEPATIDCSFRIAGGDPEIWDAETGSAFAARDFRREGSRTVVKLAMPARGSRFVMFRPSPTAGIGPEQERRAVGERALAGPWELEFPVGWYRGGCESEKVTIRSLSSWTNFADPNLKHFSGVATYRTTFRCEKGGRVVLSLGDVKNVAEVTVNGMTFPALWRPPFELDVTAALKGEGEEALEVKVANLWPNRLIGDERLPKEELEWKATFYGEALAKMPAWLADPAHETKRRTFTTWRHWHRDDDLLPSGLLGPVRLVRISAE